MGSTSSKTLNERFVSGKGARCTCTGPLAYSLAALHLCEAAGLLCWRPNLLHIVYIVATTICHFVRNAEDMPNTFMLFQLRKCCFFSLHWNSSNSQRNRNIKTKPNLTKAFWVVKLLHLPPKLMRSPGVSRLGFCLFFCCCWVVGLLHWACTFSSHLLFRLHLLSHSKMSK